MKEDNKSLVGYSRCMKPEFVLSIRMTCLTNYNENETKNLSNCHGMQNQYEWKILRDCKLNISRCLLR